jgi:succinylglutamic semialdehyde dehydrogenase
MAGNPLYGNIHRRNNEILSIGLDEKPALTPVSDEVAERIQPVNNRVYAVDHLVDDLKNAAVVVEGKIDTYVNSAQSLLIGSEFVAGEGEEFSSVDPSTGEVIYKAQEASPEQVIKVLAKAKEVFDSGIWAGLEWQERVSQLQNLVEVFKARRLEIAVALSIDTGRILAETMKEADSIIAKFEAAFKHPYANPKIVSESDSKREQVMYDPIGVVVVIGPYNIPIGLVNGPASHALVAGNSVVVKFSELTPLSGQIYAECVAQAGLPEGVFTIIQGGKAVGESLVDPEYIDGVFFTGSSQVGQKISQKLAGFPSIIQALEMSGVNPGIVDLANLEESDYLKVAKQVLESAFYTSGQRCVNCRNLYLAGSDKQIDAFESVLKDCLVEQKIGRWNDELAPSYGPLICEQAAQKVMLAAMNPIRAGKVITELKYVDGLPKSFLSPGIIEVADDYPYFGKEIFGPLLLVTRATSLQEAVRLSNRSKSVISAGFWSNSELSVEQAVRSLKAGVVNVNSTMVGASGAMPFGGIGGSGSHRPVGSATMDACVTPKAVTVNK